MTVSELIKELQEYPSDALVVMSKDAEGNRFSPLSDIEPGHYEADDAYSGEFEGDKRGGAVCLWPVS